MLTFWIIATSLIFIALIFIIPPLISKKTTNSEPTDHNLLNVAIYQERVAELAQEDLSPEQQAQAQLELEKNLAQEIKTPDNPTQPARAQWAGILVLIAIPTLAIGGYLKLGSPQLLTATAPETPAHQTNQHLPDNFSNMVEQLAARLEKQPDDAEGWYMLARSYGFLKNYEQAAKAYNKVLALEGENNPQLLTDLAETLALANDGQFAGQPTILLQTALAIDPKHQQALWLAGFAQAQKENYSQAIDYWQQFLAQVPPEDTEARKILKQHIADAQEILRRQSLPAANIEPNNEKPNQIENEPQNNEIQNKAENNSSESTVPTTSATTQLQVKVSLAPALQNQIKPTDTLFIYARATEGSPIPLAILKKTASELPITVTLNDTLAMVPSIKLSHFKIVTVLARISTSGLATVQSGDLLGQVTQVQLETTKSVAVEINEIVP
jgi:cytochrome c-type biogenesis protein CcmH